MLYVNKILFQGSNLDVLFSLQTNVYFFYRCTVRLDIKFFRLPTDSLYINYINI